MVPRGMRRGSSERVRSAWERTYDETPYDELPWFQPDPSPQVVRAVTERFLPPGAAVLDIGCGAGSNVIYLARAGFDSHGVDLSPGAIRAASERARKQKLRVDVRVGDALRLEHPTGRFGGVIDNGCFHTIPIRRRGDYAREVGRVLRGGGGFVLSWIGREYTGVRGPPHRPSLEEVARVLESRFVFRRTTFHPEGEETGPAVYEAWLTRRTARQPPPR